MLGVLALVGVSLITFAPLESTAKATTAPEAFPAQDIPEDVRPVPWGAPTIVGRRTIELGVSVGYCVGEPMPRIDHLRVSWRPDAAVVTVFVRFPAVHFNENEFCAGVGLVMRKRVKLARPLAGRTLYDGATSPPQRRAIRH
jgi:hypothetical protein